MLLPAAPPPVVVCFGDSITAGYGLPYGSAYPDFLERMLHEAGYNYKVVNRGTSGATSKDSLAALPRILSLDPGVVIVELGGNDGLRGLPISQTRNNLGQILSALEDRHIRILVAGITLPPDYGSDYIRDFAEMYRSLAHQHRAAFVPMIYKNLIGVPGSIQPDGIHPTRKGSQIIAETLMPALKPLLRR